MASTPMPTRAAGLERLAEFLPRAGARYARDRNHDRGPEDRDNVSSLSPWIRLRLLTEAEVVGEAVATHGPAAARKFVEEVCWRTYFKGWLELRPSVWSVYRDDVRRLQNSLSSPSPRRDAWQQAVAGETGIDCFDAWARELAKTGYLHNHARMWFASIWIFTLELPWQLGADLFLEHLIDGDPASNTLSWRWVAGLHTRGKTYLARPSNIRKFTGGRFDPGQRLSRTAPPVVGPPPPPPNALPRFAPPPTNRPVSLILSDDDLHPESLGLPEGHIRGVGAILGADARALGGTSPAPVAFARAGIEDALERAAMRLDAPTRSFNGADADAVGAWLEERGARDIVVPWPTVGPARDRVERLAEGLTRRGFLLWPLRREWDERLWPAATGGYFGFRKKGIPVALRLASARDATSPARKAG